MVEQNFETFPEIFRPSYSKILLSVWPSLRMSRRIWNSIKPHSEWAIQKSRANLSLYFVQILCFDQNSSWRIFIKELIFKLLTRKLKKGLGQWHPGNLNKNFEQILKGEFFWELSTFEMSKVRNFRVTSWEFLFEFWRFIFSQSICPIYSESTVFHHSDACPISPFLIT